MRAESFACIFTWSRKWRMSKCIYSGKFVKVTHNKGSRNLMPLLSKSTLNGKAGNSSTVEKSEK